MTTVSTLDPVKAVFTVSEQEYLSLARADALHRLQLKLILADETEHPHGGRFSFADRQVDPNTGAIQMTALFSNPGQHPAARASTPWRCADRRSNKGALLVPQPAVSELQGSYEVDVVRAGDQVAGRRPVEVGDRVGTMWVISKGLESRRPRGCRRTAKTPAPACWFSPG